LRVWPGILLRTSKSMHIVDKCKEYSWRNEQRIKNISPDCEWKRLPGDLRIVARIILKRILI
jgi:hypothetical protein